MMTKDEVKVVDATVEFEQALQSLILEAFGRGASIEGEWTVELPVASVPNWIVDIKKQPTDQETYSPEFIEE